MTTVSALPFRTPYALLAVTAGVLAAIALLVPEFATPRNVTSVLGQASGVGLMAVGLSIVLIGAGIDLSIPATMALAAVAGAMVVQAGSPWLGIATTLAVGLAVGLINGIAVAQLSMVPFIVTLAMMVTVTGIDTSLTSGRSYPLPAEYKKPIADLAIPLFVGATALAAGIVHRTVAGRWLYATGLSVAVARASGVPTRRVILVTYLVAGMFAGLAGLVVSARAGAAGVTLGPDILVLDVIGAALIGGVSIYGGRGSPLGAALGAVVLAVLTNVMNLLGVPFYLTLVVRGAVIVVAALADRYLRAATVTR